MTRTRSFVVAAVICSLLLSSAQGDKAPERRTYLRRLMDDGLASGLTKLEHLMTASIVSGTGSDSATAAKATAGGQENAAREAAAKKDSTSTSTATSSTSTSTETSSTSTSTATSGTTDDDSVATDDDDDDSSSTSGGGGKKAAASHSSNSTSKATASPPPNLSANVTKTEESVADWYDDDGSPTLAAGDKAEAPSGSAGGASAGSTSGSAAGTNTTLPNGRAHRDENNPHAAEMKRNNPKGDHTSTNDDDDAGYVHYNSTSNEDYVVGDDDDAPKTAADAIVSDLSEKSKKMNMGTREGYVAVFVALMAATGFGVYVANKHCQRMIKQRRRSGYQSIE